MNFLDSLPETLRQWGNARQARVFTALPARVKTYDAATQTADLEIVVRAPLVREEDEEDVAHETLPVIPSVRVLFPSAGVASITWPLAAGDEVLFVVSSLALGEYRRTGAPADAVDVRRNALGCGGWAIPGVLMDSALLASAETNALVLKCTSEIHAEATTAVQLEAPVIRAGVDASHPGCRGDATAEWIKALKNGVASAGGVVVPPPLFPLETDVETPKLKVE